MAPSYLSRYEIYLPINWLICLGFKVQVVGLSHFKLLHVVCIQQAENGYKKVYLQ